jgi:outer membrane receptor for ferrienterochelin and colicin
MKRRGLVALVLLLVATPARAQDAERIEPVVVTATRTEQRLGEAPASVTVLTREDVSRTAAQSLDDLLRQVPSFSLLSRRLTRWAEVFVGLENLLDRTYSTGRTSEGVVSIGAPFQDHGGVRLQF